MRLILEHYRATMVGLIRTPAYSLVTVMIPGVVFLFIGLSVGDSQEAANIVMASFAIFAALGVAFFQFGVGIANERESPWEQFAHVLPVSPGTRFAGNVLAAVTFAIVAVGVLIVVALILTDAAMPMGSWLRLLVAVFLGAVPMALLGIAIGYWSPPKAALPIANILYLALSFGGGLFIRPSSMPDFLDSISKVLPTRQIGELAWAAVLGQPWTVQPWLWLVGYSVLFGVIAAAGYRRDEGVRYS
jgi:ABC-2 type transport system permease protein